MAQETIARLRDQRKPGHGWFDNEIYDVFGDELRQGGISVYMTLARLCWGTRVKMSLREMAGHARMSKDTFARNLKRVIELGLVIEHKGATPQSASTYDLVDVKELAAIHMRAAVQASRSVETVSRGDSFRNVTMTQMLKPDAVTDLERKPGGGNIDCLTLRHEPDDVEIFHPAPDSVTEVSQKCTDFATEVSQDVRHLRQDSRLKTKTTPLPPQAGAALAKVKRECGISNPRLERVLGDAMTAELDRADAPEGGWGEGDFAVVADRMVQAHRMLAKVGGNGLLFRRPKVREFFGEGLWRDDGLWPWNEVALRESKRL